LQPPPVGFQRRILELQLPSKFTSLLLRAVDRLLSSKPSFGIDLAKIVRREK